MTISFETSELKEKPEITKEFLSILESRLFEIGKRRAIQGYFFVILSVFFFLCHYFSISEISFFGTKFPTNLGHIYWVASLSLSAIYLFITFMLLKEMDILGVLEGSYNALELPSVFLTGRVFSFLLYPSPLSYTYYSSRRSTSIFNIEEVGIISWLFDTAIRLIINIVDFLLPIAVILYFLFKGVCALDIVNMWLPIVFVIFCLIFLIRTYFHSGVEWINIK